MWTARASSLSGWRRRPFWSSTASSLWVRTGAPDGRAPGKMRSDVQPTSRGQPRSPSEVVERVWRATRSKGGDRDGAANLEVVLLTVSAAGSPQNRQGRRQACQVAP